MILVLVVVLPVTEAASTFDWLSPGRVYQGVHAMGIDLSADTEPVVRARLRERFELYAGEPLTLRYLERDWRATPFEIGLTFDAARTAASVLAIGREGNPVQRLFNQLAMWRNGNVSVQPLLAVDAIRQNAFLSALVRQIDQPPADARLIIRPDMRVDLVPSKVGRKVDTAELAERLRETLVTLSDGTVDIPVEETSPRVGDAAAQQASVDAEKMLSAPISLSYQGRSWVLQREDIKSMIAVDEEKNRQGEVVLVAGLSDEKVRGLLKRVAREIDRKPRDARFNYGAGRLTPLRESIDGRQLEIDTAVDLVKVQAKTDQRVVILPVSITRPTIASADAGKLGIKELVETASTTYAGSIPERKHNVELAAKRLNGVVVAPGEIFSFNNELGPTTLDAGFKTAWGIELRDGNPRTVPAEAGGICQVSTTLFQAVFWPGYQIEERYAHAYWIPKYGSAPKGLQGLDTTVDAPYLDFKFKNTTSHPLLIQSKTDGSNVTFSLYGTKPTWSVKVSGPTIESVVKTVTDAVKEEDPNLDVGKSLWVEEAQDGFKSTIVRSVTENNAVRTLRLISDYQPSRNVIRVGTRQTVQR
ncbi:MAG: VanW family protein [Chloroflexi bacterium]|nr:VanW family protein [Chloroflexota bacterium]